jgi:hypothetical protein
VTCITDYHTFTPIGGKKNTAKKMFCIRGIWDVHYNPKKFECQDRRGNTQTNGFCNLLGEYPAYENYIKIKSKPFTRDDGYVFNICNNHAFKAKCNDNDELVYNVEGFETPILSAIEECVSYRFCLKTEINRHLALKHMRLTNNAETILLHHSLGIACVNEKHTIRATGITERYFHSIKCKGENTFSLAFNDTYTCAS